MAKACELLVTLPSLNNLRNVEQVFQNPLIDGVRMNTGVQTFYSPEEVVRYLKNLAEKYKKKLWIDLKGRQLRITKWADPQYSCIEVNHNIRCTEEAKIHFRNGGVSKIVRVENGNQIYVDPLPSEALGAGQSINILSENLKIEGYLTQLDQEYLKACKKFEIYTIMASFVESFEDMMEITRVLPQAQIVAKIESKKGIEFALKQKFPNLMVARDDLFLQTGQGYEMMKALYQLINVAPNAICASKIFSSLEYRKAPDFADFSDLQLMYNLGYRRFMLSDNISNYKLVEALKAWEVFVND